MSEGEGHELSGFVQISKRRTSGSNLPYQAFPYLRELVEYFPVSFKSINESIRDQLYSFTHQLLLFYGSRELSRAVDGPAAVKQ
jgi:hypothetical protein